MVQPTNIHEFRLEEVPDAPPAPAQDAAHQAGLKMLLLGFTTLTKRLIIALSRLFTLLTIGSAFWLWMSIPDPNTHQLISIGMYAVFVLIINFIVTRRAE